MKAHRLWRWIIAGTAVSMCLSAQSGVAATSPVPGAEQALEDAVAGSIKSSAEALSGMAAPDIVAHASTEFLKSTIIDNLRPVLNSKLPQFLEVNLNDVTDAPQALHFTGTVAVAGSSTTVELAVVPTLVDRTATLRPIFVAVDGRLLGVALAGINQILANNPIKLPLEPQNLPPFDVGRELQKMPGVTPVGREIITFPPVNILRSAPLIDRGGLWLVAALPDSAGPGKPVSPEIGALTKAILATATDLLGQQIPNAPAWVAVRKMAIARWLRPSLVHFRAEIDYALNQDLPPLESDHFQPLHYESIGCDLQTDRRSCDLNHCVRHDGDTRNCAQPHDERSCGHYIHFPLGGGVHVNDPVCEAAKAAQNAAYVTAKTNCEAQKAAQNTAYAGQYSACQADAERLRVQCEAGKAGQNAIYAAQKATCETGKEVVKRLQLIGPIGNLHASGHATGSLSASVTLGPLDDDLTLHAVTTFGGKVNVRGNISFTPENAGGLLCIFPFSEPVTISTDLAGEGKTALTFSGANFLLIGKDIALEVRPSPILALVNSIFIAHPQITLNCPLPATIAGLAGVVDTLRPDVFGSAGTGNFTPSFPPVLIPLPSMPISWETGPAAVHAEMETRERAVLQVVR